MGKNSLVQRLLDSGVQFTEMTQSRAESIAKDLVKEGDVRRREASKIANSLMQRGRETAERISQMVEEEVGRQMSRMAAQIDELETRVSQLASSSRGATKSAPATKKAATKKTATRATATRTTATRTTATRTTAAKKAPAKRAAAKKAAPRKATTAAARPSGA